MSIKLTFELSTLGDLEFFVRALGAAASAPVPVENQAPATAPATAPSVTLEELRAELNALSGNGKRNEVKALLSQYGASKLTDLQPEVYDEVFNAAKEL